MDFCFFFFMLLFFFFFFQAEDGIRDDLVTGVQTCALPIYQLRKNYVSDKHLECSSLSSDISDINQLSAQKDDASEV